MCSLSFLSGEGRELPVRKREAREPQSIAIV